MNFLVLGAGGMAGHIVALYLLEKGHAVTAFAKRSLPFCKTIIGNALNKEDITKAVLCDDFDAVVNCIGVLNSNVDSNLADGIYLNSVLPHQLAALTAERRTKTIHLSTDCVFAGHGGGNYSENSFRDADTFYGRSKALGEINDNKNLTIRTSIIGPDINQNGLGLFNWFMKQNGSANGFVCAIWTGVTTLALAKAIEQAAYQNITGIYHLVNNQSISKFNLLCMFNQIRKEPVAIIPTQNAPVNKSLVNNRTDFNFIVPEYQEMINDMWAWIKNHNELYPHYNCKEI